MMTSAKIMETVAQVWEVPVGVIRGRSRRKEVAEARFAVIGLLTEEMGFASRRVATLVGCERSNITNALRRFREKAQNCPVYRRKLEQIRTLL